MRLLKRAAEPSGSAKRLFLLLTGAVSGFINGFLGTGGGIFLLFSAKLEEKMLPPAPNEKDRFAQTVSVTLILSVVSAIIYFSGSGAVDASSAVIYILPALAGGAVGAKLLDIISVRLLNTVFSLLLITAGAIMLF